MLLQLHKLNVTFSTLRVTAISFIGIILSGCVNTTYRDMQASHGPEQFNERRVSYWVSESFYNNVDNCVFVIPRVVAGLSRQRDAEASLERHLYERFERVLSGRIVRQSASRQLLDLKTSAGMNEFARQTNCSAFVSLEVSDIEDVFFMVWAKKSVTITVRLKEAKTGNLLWVARHQAQRSDGSMPLSVFSAVTSVARAVRVSSDRDLFASIIDDALRRMAKTLPSMKIQKAGLRGGPGEPIIWKN